MRQMHNLRKLTDNGHFRACPFMVMQEQELETRVGEGCGNILPAQSLI
jgi:ribosomal protein L16/L10AE